MITVNAAGETIVEQNISNTVVTTSVSNILPAITVNEVIVDDNSPSVVSNSEPTTIIQQPVETDVVTAGIVGPQGPKGLPGSAGAIYVQVLAGETLNSSLPVALDSAGFVIRANNNNPDHAAKVIGITASAAVLGSEVSVSQSGKLSNVTWTWNPGVIYVGNGVLIQTIPPTGFIQIVAVAISATEIIIGVKPPIAR